MDVFRFLFVVKGENGVFYQQSILILIYVLLSPEGQTSKSREPSKNQCSFGHEQHETGKYFHFLFVCKGSNSPSRGTHKRAPHKFRAQCGIFALTDCTQISAAPLERHAQTSTSVCGLETDAILSLLFKSKRNATTSGVNHEIHLTCSVGEYSVRTAQ
jgi:hypothetical protein